MTPVAYPDEVKSCSQVISGSLSGLRKDSASASGSGLGGSIVVVLLTVQDGEVMDGAKI